MTKVYDASGVGTGQKIGTDKRAWTSAVSKTEAFEATLEGDGYNINTGDIALTAGTASGVFYLKNNEDKDLVLEAIAIGIDGGATLTTPDNVLITFIRNPTAVSFSAAVAQNQNRNFGSNKTLTVDTFKGAEGATVTGGDDIIQVYAFEKSRSFISINLILPKGTSIAIKIDPNISSGTMAVYVAAVCYLHSET